MVLPLTRKRLRSPKREIVAAYLLMVSSLALFYWNFYWIGHLQATGSVVWNSVSSGLLLSVLIIATIHFLRTNRALELARRRNASVGVISHALRTPLTVISLYADTLMGSRTLGDEDKEYCATIAKESARLLQMLEDGLSFARFSANRQTDRMERVDIGSLVRSTFAVHERYLESSGYHLSKDIAKDELPVAADTAAVTQALDNIIQNAIKYGGESKYLRIAVYRDGPSAVVEVTDRGLGIPEEDRARVFEEFYRSGSVSGQRGWGLGLFIVKNVVDQHGGRITIDSQVGRGTRVRVYFPVPESVLEVSDRPARAEATDGTEWRLRNA